MKELIYNPPKNVAQLTESKDVILLALYANRTDGEHVTDAQKDAAMNAAKSVLQLIGAQVDANSTAYLVPSFNAQISVETTLEVYKTGELENVEEETETNEGNVETNEETETA